MNHEPRVEDIRLAEALGMDRPREIRRLIERHRGALERLGSFCVTVTQNADSRGRGRPGRTFWLNKRQALYLCTLCTKSETPRATETTIAMVEVFDAHLAARAAKPVAVAGHSRALPKPARKRRSKAVAPAQPAIERDGFAAMRLGGELLLVDLLHLDVGIGTRAVVIGWDETIVVQDMSEARSNAKSLGDRNFVLPDPGEKVGIRSVWAVGTVVASQPVAAPGKGAKGRPRPAKSPRPRGALPAQMPDLARAEVRGTA